MVTMLSQPFRILPVLATSLRHQSLRAMSTPSDLPVLTSRSASNAVAIFTLNRPKALNALSSPLFNLLNDELEKADRDDSVKAIVITGGEKVFAAGADIKEMRDKSCTRSNSSWLKWFVDGEQSQMCIRRTSWEAGIE